MKYVCSKYQKEFMKDLKPVYGAVTKEAGEMALDKLEEKWGEQYPIVIKSWRDNWDRLSEFFQYSETIRKLIYTTNTVEGYHRQIRKVTKNKGVFSNDTALTKLVVYLAYRNVRNKWTMPIPNWGIISQQLAIKSEIDTENEWFYETSADMEINNATTVSIDCKRINFAIKVIVNNLTKGSVLLENSSLGNETIYPENPTYESIYAFYNAKIVLKEGYDRGYGYPTSIYYVREDGMKELLYTLQEYVLRRNQKTVITLNIKSQEISDKTNASFSVSLDSSTFSENPIVVTQE